jgi:hypothetical protein
MRLAEDKADWVVGFEDECVLVEQSGAAYLAQL